MADDERVLLPELDDDSRPFWEHCRAGELRVQRCTGCGRRRFPPRPLCPWCHRFDHEWTALSGLGTVWSVAIPHPPLLGSYSAQAPYAVVVVAAEEDPLIRFVGNLVDTHDGPLDEVDPHSIAIGEPVEVLFRPTPDPDIWLPAWRRSPAR